MELWRYFIFVHLRTIQCSCLSSLSFVFMRQSHVAKAGLELLIFCLYLLSVRITGFGHQWLSTHLESQASDRKIENSFPSIVDSLDPFSFTFFHFCIYESPLSLSLSVKLSATILVRKLNSVSFKSSNFKFGWQLWWKVRGKTMVRDCDHVVLIRARGHLWVWAVIHRTSVLRC